MLFVTSLPNCLVERSQLRCVTCDDFFVEALGATFRALRNAFDSVYGEAMWPCSKSWDEVFGFGLSRSWDNTLLHRGDRFDYRHILGGSNNLQAKHWSDLPLILSVFGLGPLCSDTECVLIGTVYHAFCKADTPLTARESKACWEQGAWGGMLERMRKAASHISSHTYTRFRHDFWFFDLLLYSLIISERFECISFFFGDTVIERNLSCSFAPYTLNNLYYISIRSVDTSYTCQIP